MQGELIVGLMSGTSLDGVDAALVEFNGAGKPSLLESHFTPYDAPLKQEINQLALSQNELPPNNIATLDKKLAQIYAQTSLELIQASGLPKESISAIANHGQTVRHQPNANPPLSLQLGNAQTIANLTNLPTIGNFRQADLAAGGQGAPLMPAFHQAVFSANECNRYLLNLGGIANITQLAADSDLVIGFDTGPGNALMDQWIQKHLNVNFDHNGEWATSGNLLNEVLDRLMKDPYFRAAHPKSTGTDYFNLAWLQTCIESLEEYSPPDIQATLLELTVQSVANSVLELQQSTSTHLSNELYVCGGGAHNQGLLEQLQKSLPRTVVRTTNALGIDADWVEAIGFAWLGYCHLHDLPSNMPSVTGANKAVVLGDYFSPSSS